MKWSAVRARAVAPGARMVKLKIAPGHDVEPLERPAQRSAHDGVPLAADANGSYADARAGSRGATNWVSPTWNSLRPATHTWDELATLPRSGCATPVALDESLTSPTLCARRIAAGALDVMSVKPARWVGSRRRVGRQIRCRESDVDAFVGGCWSSGSGGPAAAAVAAMPGCSLPTDLGPSADYVRDRCLCADRGRSRRPAARAEWRGSRPDTRRRDARRNHARRGSDRLVSGESRRWVRRRRSASDRPGLRSAPTPRCQQRWG